MQVHPIAVVDVETTGLSPWRNDRIVEIAVVVMTPDGKIHREYETLVNPDRDLGPTRIHQITAAEVLHAPQFPDIAGDVAELLTHAQILAGHNVSFDRNFLVKEYARLGITMPEVPVLCTCQLLGRQNLAACCEEYDVQVTGEPHRAICDARATAALIERLVADDPAILMAFPSTKVEWPAIPPRRTTCVSRDLAQKRMREPPRFLQRILSTIHHDVDATAPNVVAYLALVDRVLEDRVVEVHEENALVDAVSDWGLSRPQLEEAHRTYIHNLAVRALADGVVTETERADLYQVARLLGREEGEVDGILESAAAQLQTSKAAMSAGSPSEDLSGKRICFTGELRSRINGEPISRDIAEALAEQAGLAVASSVTKKLDMLVVADPNTQSGKAKKARQYGIRIVAESVFWPMIGIAVE
jgi:DNA polymerase-3 subunit epsilon